DREAMAVLGLDNPRVWGRNCCCDRRNALLLATPVQVGKRARYVLTYDAKSRAEPFEDARHLEAALGGPPRMRIGQKPLTPAKPRRDLFACLAQNGHQLRQAAGTRVIVGRFEPFVRQEGKTWVNAWRYEDAPVMLAMRRFERARWRAGRRGSLYQ